MLDFDWDEKKNKRLKKERGVSFEDVVAAIIDKRVLEDTSNPNKLKYQHQYILIIEINNYAYVVPYVITKDCIFLKTIYPSRRETKHFLK